jgi:hypothetical protein
MTVRSAGIYRFLFGERRKLGEKLNLSARAPAILCSLESAYQRRYFRSSGALGLVEPIESL